MALALGLADGVLTTSVVWGAAVESDAALPEEAEEAPDDAADAELPVAVIVLVPEPEAVLVEEEPDLVVVAEMAWLLLVSAAVLEPVTEDDVGLAERGKAGEVA